MSEGEDDRTAQAQERVGTVLREKYRLERVLGVGGMATVYAGMHRNGRRVAVKLLHPELAARKDIRMRFVREALAANSVDHPGAVAVIDDDVAEDGSTFLVMERLEGKSLEQLWAEGGQRLPARMVLELARDLCDVLVAAHRAGIVHRDLKPENLFLTNDGTLKVLDFGLAQLRDTARPKETHTGMVFGTPAFMPPEQASGQTSQVDARTDLWAVGATMFTLLSGQTVHEGESAQHLVVLSATKPARSLRTVVADAHPALVALVDRALSQDKHLRWSSASAMRDAADAANDAMLADERTEGVTEVVRVDAGDNFATEPDIRRSALRISGQMPMETTQTVEMATQLRRPRVPEGEPSHETQVLASRPRAVPIPLAAPHVAPPVRRAAATRDDQPAPAVATRSRSTTPTSWRDRALPFVVVGAALLGLSPVVYFIRPRRAAHDELRPLEIAAPAPRRMVEGTAASSEPPTASSAVETATASPPTTPPRKIAVTEREQGQPSPASPPPASAAVPTRPPADRCAETYRLDSDGIKRWKPECLR